MTDLLPAQPVLMAFLFASFVLAITPGPGIFYIVARSMQSRRIGLASVIGVAAGNLGNAIGASVGLAALFSISSIAFVAVKWAGAVYLIYLGLRAILAPSNSGHLGVLSPTPLQKIVRDGFIVALLNPKTALFFAAFLPQFISTDASMVLQSVLLSCVFVAIAATTDVAYAFTASAASATITGSRTARRGGRYLRGGAFIGLGLFTALGGNRRSG
ncbi:MAG: LysE family translocator [Gammaproteobacteria bacterium]|nr:LysE family translocator [Gammaproteobacteria bacterium]